MVTLALSKKIRFHVLARDGFKCRYCGKSSDVETLEVDHIIPVCRGGSNEESNLAASCKTCNRGKQNSAIFTPTVSRRKDDSTMQTNFRIPIEVNQRLKVMAAHNKQTSVSYLINLINSAWDSEDSRETREFLSTIME